MMLSLRIYEYVGVSLLIFLIYINSFNIFHFLLLILLINQKYLINTDYNLVSYYNKLLGKGYNRNIFYDIVLFRDFKDFLNFLLTIDVYSKSDLVILRYKLKTLLSARKVSEFVRFPEYGTFLVLNNSVYYDFFLELTTVLAYPSDYFSNEDFLVNNLNSLLTVRKEYKKILHLMLRVNQHDDLKFYNIFNRTH